MEKEYCKRWLTVKGICAELEQYSLDLEKIFIFIAEKSMSADID